MRLATPNLADNSKKRLSSEEQFELAT